MAIVTGYVTSSGLSFTASATATANSQGIGTAVDGRIVVVGATVEDNVDFTACTIGGVNATLVLNARDTGGTPDNAAAIFYAIVPASVGATANIAVTVSGAITQTGRISIWVPLGAAVPPSGSNSATGSAVSINLAGITIKPGGAAFYIFNNATAATACTWTGGGVNVRDQTAVANYRASSADTTVAGTPTVNADAATANQVIVGMALDALEPVAAWDHSPTNDLKPPLAKLGLATIAASGLIFALAPPSPPTVDNTAPGVGWQQPSPYVVSTSLYYQSVAYCPPPVVAADNNIVGMGWHQPLSSVPAVRLRAAQNPTYVPQPPRVETVAWLVKWERPPRGFLPLPGGQVYVTPPVAAPSNTTTVLWPLAQGEKARQVPRVAPQGHHLSVLSLPAAAADNTAPGVGWSSPSPYVISTSLYYQSQFYVFPPPPAAANTVTGTGYIQQTSQAPQKTWPPKSASELRQFAVPDGTTPQGWQQQFTAPVARRPFHRTQPVFVPRPVAAPDNNITGMAWQEPWTTAAPVPRSRSEQKPGYVPQPPVAAPNNNITGMGWWRAPEQARPIPRPAPQGYVAFGYPYLATIPDAVQFVGFSVTGAQVFSRTLQYQDTAWCPYPVTVADNNITGIGWHQAFTPPTPRRPFAWTQPLYAPQFIAPTDNNITGMAWHQPFPLVPYRSLSWTKTQVGFVPTGYSNTIDGMGWHQPFLPAAAKRPFSWTQPVYVQVGFPNTIVGMAWHQPFGRMPLVKPVQSSPYIPARFFPNPPNTIVGMAWHQPFPRMPLVKPRYSNVTYTAAPRLTVVFAQNVDADVTVTVDLHICGWGTETEAADGFIVQAEGSDPWSEQAESVDDYDEKDECGR